MAVTTGTTALASEYNTLRTAVNRVMADNYAGSISFGNSNQTYGYGGSSVASVVAGQSATAAQMNYLRNSIYSGADLVPGIAVGDIPPAISPGDDILASQYNALQTDMETVRVNRLTIEDAECSLTTRGSSSRTVNWGSEVNAIYRFTFASFDKARYFFNAGGRMRFWGQITGYSTGTGWDGAGFNQIFSNMGTVEMNYTATSQTGSGGTPTGIGYYNLTTSWVTIFTQTGTGAYTNAVLQLQARRSTSGNYCEVICRLTPEAGRTVNGTTTVWCGQRKMDNYSYGTYSVSITAPTYTLTNTFN